MSNTTTTLNTTLAALLQPAFTGDRLAAAGMSDAEAKAKGALFAQAAQRLIDAGQRADAKAVAVFVPGRIEVMGKHTDYCGGRSLICTVERGMCFVAVPRADRAIRFFAVDQNDSATFALDRDLEPAQRHWSNYPMTVARRVARNFPTATVGADIAMASDLPAASGLSSSSAMIVGCFMLLDRINDFSAQPIYQRNLRSREDLGGYLGCCENGQNFGELTGDKGVGTFGGSQDHTAILCSKPGKLSVYSFCPVIHERDVELPADVRFLIVDSGLIAEKTGDAMEQYNRVSLRARRLVTLWNESHPDKPVTCLREAVTSGDGAVEALRQLANGAEAEMELPTRLQQFLTESTELIPGAAVAVAQQDWAALRRIVDDSQRGAETGLRNQVPGTIALQRRLLETGAIAASAFGAGFGGSVWGLYRNDAIEAAQSALGRDHRQFATRPGVAAMEISA